MQRIIFSKKYPHYKYEAERAYLRNQPQTKEIIQQRVELLYELAMRDVPYFAHFQKSYNGNQPRVPAGSTGAGQWVGANIGRGQPHDDHPTTGTIKPAIGNIGRDSNHDGLLHDAHYTQMRRKIPRIPGIYGLAARTAFELYRLWHQHQENNPNNGSSRDIIEFENSEYRPVEGGQVFDLVGTRILTREETLSTCPRLAEVQSRVDRIDAETRMDYPYLSAQQHGTAVHKLLADEIKALDDPNFVAEVSILKTDEAKGYASYGRADTIRIDVLEKVDTQTTCVYDIKTGRAGLSVSRSQEIAGEVYKAFGKVNERVIVTEVRPNR